MSTLHRRTTPTAGRVIYALLPKGPNGRALCRFCKRECPRPRMTFCGDDCVHEHKLRSDPGYLREQVLKRDKGVCAVCTVDTVALLADLMRRTPAARRKLVKALGYPPHRVKAGTLWDADHIRPVAEGGGECGLANIQSVCIPCHRRKSSVQAAHRT